MVTVLVYAGIAVGAVALLALVVWLSDRMLHTTDEGTGSVGTAFGNAFEAFDPGQARARRELDAHEAQGSIAPTPDDDHPPLSVDLRGGRATVRPKHPPA